MPWVREACQPATHRSTVLPCDRSTLATHIQLTQQSHEKSAIFTCSSCRRLAFWTWVAGAGAAEDKSCVARTETSHTSGDDLLQAMEHALRRCCKKSALNASTLYP